jgi:hypothetical protein
MALNPNLLRSALGARATAPVTVAEGVAAFGGGSRGRSALAQEMAGTRDKKSKAYKTAMRNLQRYMAAEGKQRRRPKTLTPRITRAVERRRERALAERIRGPIQVIWQDPVVRVSQEERDRPDLEVSLSDDMLEDFREYLASGNERGALNALAVASLEAWGTPGDAEILSASGLVILR